MAKIGRNDPCPCGSGKKYKQCHAPIDEQREAERRSLRRAQDTLLPKLLEAAQAPEVAAAVPQALERFWNGQYSVSDLAELDDHEDRGADRFLTWFAFDYPLDDGQTLVERLASKPESIEPTPHEAQLLAGWRNVRLRPYLVTGVRKGQGFTVRSLAADDAAEIEVEDHAASKHVQPEEVVVVHLLPAADRHYIAGAAAHLTSDTQEQMRQFIAMHRGAYAEEHPDADGETFVRANSHLFNHFVMALPREEGQPSKVDELLVQGRISLQMAAEALRLRRSQEEGAEAENESETQGAEAAEEGAEEHPVPASQTERTDH